MPNILTEGVHAGEFVLSEGNGHISREAVQVLSGQNLVAGAVIAMIVGGVGGAPVPAVVGTGDGVMTNVKPGASVQAGSYVVTCTAAVTHGGVFSVVAPDGSVLPVFTLTPGTGGTSSYKSSHMDFDITDGSADFEVDDVFTIVVSTTVPVVIGTGDGVMTSLSLGSESKSGTYTVKCTAAVTNGGTFSITDPDGNALADMVLSAGASNTTAYESDQVNFSITDGSADFVVDDVFYVAVFGSGANAGTVLEYDPTGVDGREDPYGILFDAVDASLAETTGVAVARLAEVVGDSITWGSAVTSAQKAVAIEKLANARRIFVR
ncbi:MAG: head decoration protein [Candidatus Peribacteraceae bacterium]|nr:head decoration protein [Candidatus Peribacteraceae bacterium]